jgi:hypothetical protein
MPTTWIHELCSPPSNSCFQARGTKHCRWHNETTITCTTPLPGPAKVHDKALSASYLHAHAMRKHSLPCLPRRKRHCAPLQQALANQADTLQFTCPRFCDVPCLRMQKSQEQFTMTHALMLLVYTVRFWPVHTVCADSHMAMTSVMLHTAMCRRSLWLGSSGEPIRQHALAASTRP